MSKIKKFIYSIATLSGTTVGVGLFSLPYITSKTGFWVMAGYFLILGTIVALVHMIYGELSLATPDFKRMPGFAKFHLGEWGKRISLASSIFGAFGAILAYLIVGGGFLETLLSPFLNIEGNIFYTLIYFLAGAWLIFFGIKAIAQIEFWGLTLFFLVLVAIFFKAFPIIESSNFVFSSSNFNIGNFLLPYGPVLFSLWGATLIPEVEEMLGKDKKMLKRVIPLAVLIPIIIYGFFIYLILGITGPNTTESALTGLRDYLGNGMVNLALFLGILTTFTSFITLGFTLKRVFWYDLKINKNLAWAIACFPPLLLFLSGLKDFIAVISLVGGITLGIEGILILLMYRAFKNKKGRSTRIEALTLSFSLIFILGIAYEIYNYLIAL
jgi:tyrosine-specific transport protein